MQSSVTRDRRIVRVQIHSSNWLIPHIGAVSCIYTVIRDMHDICSVGGEGCFVFVRVLFLFVFCFCSCINLVELTGIRDRVHAVPEGLILSWTLTAASLPGPC